MTTRRYHVHHRTEYRYSLPMNDGFTMTTLLPRSTSSQHVVSARLDVDPRPDEWSDDLDAFGNQVTRFAVHQPHETLVIDARSVVDVTPPVLGPVRWPSLQQTRSATQAARGSDALDVDPYLAPSLLVPRSDAASALREELSRSAGVDDDASMLAVVHGWCRALHESFVFDAGFSDVTTPLDEVIAARRGVCQDFAHVAIAMCRDAGLAARYVSGYIETLPPPGQPRLVGADASHAWCAVWVPGAGWVEFDPTNDQVPPQRHVVVGWGRDYADVAPVRGVVIGPAGSQELIVSVDVVGGDPSPASLPS